MVRDHEQIVWLHKTLADGVKALNGEPCAAVAGSACAWCTTRSSLCGCTRPWRTRSRRSWGSRAPGLQRCMGGCMPDAQRATGPCKANEGGVL